MLSHCNKLGKFRHVMTDIAAEIYASFTAIKPLFQR